MIVARTSTWLGLLVVFVLSEVCAVTASTNYSSVLLVPVHDSLELQLFRSSCNCVRRLARAGSSNDFMPNNVVPSRSTDDGIVIFAYPVALTLDITGSQTTIEGSRTKTRESRVHAYNVASDFFYDLPTLPASVILPSDVDYDATRRTIVTAGASLLEDPAALLMGVRLDLPPQDRAWDYWGPPLPNATALTALSFAQNALAVGGLQVNATGFPSTSYQYCLLPDAENWQTVAGVPAALPGTTAPVQAVRVSASGSVFMAGSFAGDCGFAWYSVNSQQWAVYDDISFGMSLHFDSTTSTLLVGGVADVDGDMHIASFSQGMFTLLGQALPGAPWKLYSLNANDVLTVTHSGNTETLMQFDSQALIWVQALTVSGNVLSVSVDNSSLACSCDSSRRYEHAHHKGTESDDSVLPLVVIGLIGLGLIVLVGSVGFSLLLRYRRADRLNKPSGEKTHLLSSATPAA